MNRLVHLLQITTAETKVGALLIEIFRTAK